VLRAHPNLSLLLFVYLAVLGWVTLTPAGNIESSTSALAQLAQAMSAGTGLRWIDFALVEFAANIILFVPMGVIVLLLLGRERWWVVIAVGVIASCWIELAQGVWLPSRVADPRDLVSNSLGTALGVALVFLAAVPRARRVRGIDKRTARQAGA
jgi:glycopeptide antibiotics resistance protein